MRQQLIRSLVLMIVLSTGAVLGVAIYFAERSVETLSRNVITQTSERTALELDRFFRPIEEELREIQGWGGAGVLRLSDPRGFLRLVQPFVEEHPEITGLLFARDDGAEIFLLVEDNGIAVRQIPPEQKAGRRQAVWSRWIDGRSTESWTESTDYDATTRPWFKGALALPDARQTFWTEPYTFYTTKVPGITAAARFRHAGRRWVAGVDVSLLGISRFTTSIGVSENGAVAVLSDSGRVVGLPRNPLFADDAQFRTSMLKPVSEIGVPFLGEAVAAGIVGQDKSAYRFSSDGKDYWGGARRFSLSPERPLLIQAAVPQSDLVGDLQRQRNIILLVIAVSLMVAVVVAYALGRRYDERIDAAVNQAQQLGQYTLEKRIGSGGMGSVYRARHAMLRRPTAVKLLNPKSSDPDAFARFEREVQLTAQLTHPNTIAVYDYGRTAEGVFYYAMEYLEGLSMRQLVKRFGPVNEARAIHLLRQIAGSLEEAHQAGLVHRDVKPANVFVTERGGQLDVVKVLDFGLVEETDAERSDRGRRLVVGTPAYMAPEVIRDPDRISPLVDIYSFGCLAYYLVTGSPVFRGEDNRSIYKKQLEDTPRPPSSRLKSPLTEEFEKLILSCLKKAPSDRPKSMRTIMNTFDAMPLAYMWDEGEARSWWARHSESKNDSEVGDAELDRALLSIAIDLAGRDKATLDGTKPLPDDFSYPSLSSVLDKEEAAARVS